MTQSFNLARLLIWPQSEIRVEESRLKFLLKSEGRRKDQTKDRSQDIVLEMRETSRNKALLAQAAFLPNSLR